MAEETESDAAPIPPPEEPKVEIHKPKPVHNWREFLIELGTITLGVLIALVAEQTAQAFHDHQRVAQARENLYTEIAANLGQIAFREGTEGCISRRLSEVEGLIRALANGSQQPVWLGHPTLFLMTNSQYTAAAQSGSVSLLSNPEQVRYAAIYAGFEEYSQAELSEQTAWADLRMLELHPAATPEMDGLLRSALQKARNARWQIEVSTRTIQSAALPLGIRPNAKPGFTEGFTQQSVCIPVNTTREEGEKLVVKGRRNGHSYDEP